MKRIVVVDEEKRHRRTICEILLTCPDYQCTPVETARAALVLLEKNPPYHLVITDIFMPNMSGLDLLQQMAERGLLNRIPVIMMVGRVSQEVEQWAKMVGAKLVLEKSVDPDTLLQVVARALVEGK